ncbi:MAG TPA: FtsQ-type POTRA domain-containing protein [Gemmatimonadales bacterium]|nr:FtsQ-type POTRA domain-containing protein [Gemmatimonadales bacterium]
MAERRLTPRWRALAIAAAVLILTFLSPSLLRRLDFFRVRRVEISGLHYLEAAKVVAALKLSRSASIFDDPAPLERRVRAVPGVTAAEVGRRAPGTLRIILRETAPVALTPKLDRLALVDSAGNVLPFDPLASSPDLPVLIGGGALVTRALARVRDYDPALFARIDAAWRVGPDVVFEVGGRWFWFGAQLTAEDIRAVTAVERTLARQGRAFRELDGRFAGQVIVRWSRA